MLICPRCRNGLSPNHNTLVCSENHSFDCSKSGYINLLLANQKRSRFPGDSKEMIAARRDFLSSGVYQPIAEKLASLVMILGQGEPKVIADAGCGEGYYLRQIQRLAYPNQGYFNTNGGQFIGWDISKFAADSAAKQATFDATWLAASNAAIPLADDTVDILISSFGFEVAQEFQRVLAKQGQGGYLITLDAGEQHLIELRNIIYDEIRPYQAKPLIDEKLFNSVKEEQLRYEVNLNATQITQLMTMTPHLYRATSAGKKQLSEITDLPLTIDVLFRIYHCK